MIIMNGVTKTYENKVTALMDVNLHIKKGEFVFIIGSSGAGKSTLAKLIIHEEVATSGEILVDAFNVTRIKRRYIPYLRRSIGMVFQDFRLLPNYTVYENLAFAMRVIGSKPRDIKTTIPNVLNMVGLSKRAKAFPSELSGGEQQRIAIARSLVNNPKLVIADEPTGNLDPATSLEIAEILNEINLRGTTVMVVTHDQLIVDHLKKRVVTFESGVIIHDEERGGYNYEG